MAIEKLTDKTFKISGLYGVIPLIAEDKFDGFYVKQSGPTTGQSHGVMLFGNDIEALSQLLKEQREKNIDVKPQPGKPQVNYKVTEIEFPETVEDHATRVSLSREYANAVNITFCVDGRWGDSKGNPQVTIDIDRLVQAAEWAKQHKGK